MLDYTKRKIRAFLSELRRVEASEFPHTDYEGGIHYLEALFEKRAESLNKLTNKTSPDIVRAACRDALHQLFIGLPLLGFFLRSTNVRNAFEIHGPLRRIARKLLDEDACLVISSEWDFSPFTYPPSTQLPVVMIGLPASESGNGLTLPLAGHELGHSVWMKRALSKEFEKTVRGSIVQNARDTFSEYQHYFGPSTPESVEDLTGQANWLPAYEWTMAKAEESFCDFLGLLLFGKSFFYAFGYLMAPGHPTRSTLYPPIETRIANMLTAAGQYGISSPDLYADQFQNPPASRSFEPKNEYLWRVSEAALANTIPELIKRAKEVVAKAGIKLPSDEEKNRAVAAFRIITPCYGSISLAGIVNAGWECSNDPALWEKYAHIRDKRDDVLNDLILKSCEIAEYEALLAEAKIA